MPSRSGFGLLLRKEVRELVVSRSFWLLLLATSGLVIHAFATSTALYAEASGAGGGPAALAQGLNPLDGIIVPVLGVYDLVATLLLPFVVIRVFSSERANNMQPMLLQFPPTWRTSVAAKAAALALAWGAAGVAGALALASWAMTGGHLHGAEVGTVVLGHVLRGGLTIAIGAAAAAFASNPATASMLVLGATIGSWALDYVAAARGGAVAFLSQFTPSAALRVFERGELRVSTIVAVMLCSVAGLSVAVIWMQEGRPAPARARSLAMALCACAALIVATSQVRASADVSEDRRSSFSEPEEEALRTIRGPIAVGINLSAQDPRLADFERDALAKLRRVADVRVTYTARGRTGLFEPSDSHYGEITYDVGGRRAMSRSVSERIVLETILGAAGIAPPSEENETAYRGYPLTATPSAGSYVLQALWPLFIIGMWWRRRPAVAHAEA